MPRFFFDIHDDVNIIDSVGQELANLMAAKDQAARALTEVAKDDLPGAGMLKTFTVHVRDESNRVALTATLSFVAQVVA